VAVAEAGITAAAPAIGDFTAAPAVIAMPASAEPVVLAKAEPFVLPLAELAAVADSAGLQWVNSDPDKVRTAQEAMANAPRPIHVPREPKPVVAIDEGPLVLVETRKDLSQFKLPFDTQQASH
jgi:ribonuclease E